MEHINSQIYQIDIRAKTIECFAFLCINDQNEFHRNDKRLRILSKYGALILKMMKPVMQKFGEN